MSDDTAVHGSFTIERVYPAAPARVFRAWADLETKARWFIGPEGWTPVERRIDFREGGEEYLEGRFASGTVTRYLARSQEIRPDRRLVFVYDMHVDRLFMSVSLATVEIRPEGRGSRLRFTEQAVYLDGKDGTQGRERGTAAHLDRLTAVLQG